MFGRNLAARDEEGRERVLRDLQNIVPRLGGVCSDNQESGRAKRMVFRKERIRCAINIG
jgi:hypothetical protein